MLIRKSVVARRLGVSEKTVDRLVRAGKFPRPIRFGGHTLRWADAAVDAYLNALTTPPASTSPTAAAPAPPATTSPVTESQPA
jgi:predicted DNA-binding transcriptional regulator AlpA